MDYQRLLIATKWSQVIRTVLQRAPHEDLLLSKQNLPHPESTGFFQGSGEPQGELANYRKTLSDGKSVHIREYEDCYTIHWDRYDPGTYLIEHLLYDAPHWLIIFLGIAGAGIWLYN